MPRGVYERKKKETAVAEEETPASVEQPELTASTPAPASKKKTPDGDVCEACWPSGWPEDTAAATCLHGSWTK